MTTFENPEDNTEKEPQKPLVTLEAILGVGATISDLGYFEYEDPEQPELTSKAAILKALKFKRPLVDFENLEEYRKKEKEYEQASQKYNKLQMTEANKRFRGNSEETENDPFEKYRNRK
jgi:hypothetical protein